MNRQRSARPSGDDAEAERAAARTLADALCHGGQLEPRSIECAALRPGELGYADVRAMGWRYCGIDDVGYEHRTVLVGGPLLMSITGVASVLGNQRRRHEAERAAAPQWRPLGPLRVVVTSDRLLVWHDSAWWSVWFDAVVDIRSDPVNGTIDLFFDADPPYRLAGQHMLSLDVMLRHAVSKRLSSA